jgi:hypothetical protein
MVHFSGQIQQMAELHSCQVGVAQVKELQAEHIRAVNAEHLEKSSENIVIVHKCKKKSM